MRGRPSEVIERVGAWLDQDAPASGERPGGHAAPPAMSEQREAILSGGGVELRETPLVLDGPGGELFGVLTEPLGEARGLTAVLLNAGPQRRTGPSRMWVEIARRWAAKGVTTFRLDAEGIGDSAGDAAALGRVAAFYRPVYVEQAGAALDALAERGLPPRFVVLGLCSGAYWSAQTAIADERVSAVIMLNPRTLVFDEWRHAARRTRHLRERALMPSTWARVLRGEVKLGKHLETGRSVLQQAAGAPRRAGRRIATAQPPEQQRGRAVLEQIEALLDRLRDRDQRALLLFTGAEILRREMGEHGTLDRLDRWPNLELALMGTEADTHTLTPLWLQRQVHALLDRVLEDELDRTVQA